MKLMYVKPKSKIDTLRKKPTERRPENYMSSMEARVKAGRGDTYHLMKEGKDTKAVI